MKFNRFVFVLFIVALFSLSLTSAVSAQTSARNFQLSSIIESLKKILASFQSLKQTQTAAVSDFASNLVWHSTFDDTAGDATVAGGHTYVAGKIGRAMSFDGVDDVVSKSNFNMSSDFTITAWIDGNGHIVYQGGSASASRWVLIGGSGNKLGFYTDGSGWRYGTQTLGSGWNHVTAVGSGGTLKFYVNGVLDNTAGTIASIANNNTTLTIGKSANSVFRGSIDDLRIYNKALSASEIGELYALGGSSVPASQPVNPPAEQQVNISVANNQPVVQNPVTLPSVSATGNATRNGTTVTAATCSQIDVQTGIDMSVDGDIVIIPAGNCMWSIQGSARSMISILDKQITLKGAGRDSTKITANLPTPIANGHSILQISTSKPFRITGFELNGTMGEPAVIQINSRLPYSTPLKGWRIDHMRISYFGGGINPFHAIFLSTFIYGVIDHNEIIGDRGNGVHVQANPNDPLSIPGTPILGGNTDWNTPLSLGTDNAVFVEDNYFKGNRTNVAFVNDQVMGSRMVFVKNKIHNMTIQTHSGGHVHRGGLSYEIYNNEFIGDPGYSTFRPAEFRSGTGVVFNNTVTGTYDRKDFTIDNKRSSQATSFGLCDGSSFVDSNTPGTAGWPCIDQIGRGPTNNVSASLTIGKKSDGTPAQPSEPLYAWNNGVSKLALGPGGGGPNNHLKTYGDPNPHPGGVVDYVNGACRPGYTPYAYPHPTVQQQDGVGPQPIALNCPNGPADSTYTPPRDQSPATPTSSIPPTPQNPDPDTDQDGIKDTLDLCLNTPSTLRSKTGSNGCPLPKVTNFDIKPNLATLDFTSINFLELGKTNVGRIRWNKPVSIADENSELDLDSNITFAKNKVTVNSTNLTQFKNTEALVTIYTTVTNPKILKDGSPCTTCTINSYANGILTFTVEGFSIYEVTEGDTPPVITPEAPSITQEVASSGTNRSSKKPTATSPDLTKMSRDELIAYLKAKITELIIELQAQILRESGSTNPSSPQPLTPFIFTKDLQLNTTDPEVFHLQRFLNTHGYPVGTNIGSYGKEVNTFGPVTKATLIKFQKANNINPTGFFGPVTRGKVNQLNK